MLRQNVIPFWKELFVTFKMTPNMKKLSLYFSSHRPLYKGHSCILDANCNARFGTCADLCMFLTKWHRILDASLRNNTEVACRKNKCIILFQSQVNRHVCVCDVINVMINVIMSYLLVMSSLCRFHCVLLKTCLICHNAASSIYRVITFYVIFKHFFCFLNVFTFIKICSICLVFKTR